jgi:hypothetical protein
MFEYIYIIIPIDTGNKDPFSDKTSVAEIPPYRGKGGKPGPNPFRGIEVDTNVYLYMYIYIYKNIV